MKESFSTENYRVPTSRWSGYGFSQTSPGHILSPNIQNHIVSMFYTNELNINYEWYLHVKNKRTNDNK